MKQDPWATEERRPAREEIERRVEDALRQDPSITQKGILAIAAGTAQDLGYEWNKSRFWAVELRHKLGISK
jgi:hypothetical protein